MSRGWQPHPDSNNRVARRIADAVGVHPRIVVGWAGAKTLADINRVWRVGSDLFGVEAMDRMHVRLMAAKITGEWK